jgi:hypothetical protein
MENDALPMEDENSSWKVDAAEPETNEMYRPVDFGTGNTSPQDCYPQAATDVADLLPKDAANTKWAQVNPAGQGDVKNQQFLTAGTQIGINTVGGSLRNPSYDLRSAPPNPRQFVSIWNQSTITPDLMRRPLEIGSCG